MSWNKIHKRKLSNRLTNGACRHAVLMSLSLSYAFTDAAALQPHFRSRVKCHYSNIYMSLGERKGNNCSAFSSRINSSLLFLPSGAAAWAAHSFPGPEFPHLHVRIILVSHHLSHLLSSPCCYKNLRHIYVWGEETCKTWYRLVLHMNI